MTPRILVADDSATIQKVVELTFSKEDFQIVKAVSGLEAIAKARETRPDIVLLDLSMPDKNGYEVCESLRSDPLLRDTPIILLVGAFESFDQERGRNAGADDFVTKPFESKQLIAKVKQHIFARAARLSAEKAQEEVELMPTEVGGIGPAGAPSEPTGEPGQAIFSLEPEPAISVSGLEGPAMPDEEMKEPSWGWEEMPVAAPVSTTEPSREGDVEGGVSDEELWKMLDLSAPETETLLPGLKAEEKKEEEELTLVAEDSPEAFFELYSQPTPPPAIEKEEEKEGAGLLVEEKEAEATAEGPLEGAVEMISFDNLSEAILEEEALLTAPDRAGVLEGLVTKEETRETEEEIGVAEEEVEVPREEEAEAALVPEGPAEVAISGQLIESLADRIVKEVTERLVSRIERIIWEVVPDLAEVLITKEIEKIKALAEEKEIS